MSNVIWAGMQSPNGPGGPPPPTFLAGSKLKLLRPPSVFTGEKGPIKVGPITFQKGDYIPDGLGNPRILMNKSVLIAVALKSIFS